jgi:hypothetical protein
MTKYQYLRKQNSGKWAVLFKGKRLGTFEYAEAVKVRDLVVQDYRRKIATEGVPFLIAQLQKKAAKTAGLP